MDYQDLDEFFIKTEDPKIRSCSICGKKSDKPNASNHLKNKHNKKLFYSSFCCLCNTGDNSLDKIESCSICGNKNQDELMFDIQVIKNE